MTDAHAPAPLVDAEVDLRDFVFMPLDVVRLRDSGLATKASGDAFRAAVLLWCAAWHQVPSSSLPDDDDELAKLAGYGRDVKGWRKIRPSALRGFIKCSDGRFYHEVIADKARGSWKAKLAQRARTKAATEARLAKQAAERGAGKSGHEQRNEERDEARDVKRHEHQGRVKGEGEVRDNRSSLRSDRVAIDDAFGKFSSIFPKDDAPDDVRRELARRLDEGVGLDDILSGARRYAEECRSENRAKKHIAAPARWLEGGRWLDGKPKAEVVLPVVKKGTPQGDAWERHLGKSNIWIDGRRTVATEWPPESQESAA